MSLTDDDYFLLEPSVELVENPQRTGEFFLLDRWHQTAILVPPGEGLRDFVEALEEPCQVAELIEEYEDEDLVQGMLAALLRVGCGYVVDAPELGSSVSELRERWDATWGRKLRESVVWSPARGDLRTVLSTVTDAPAPAELLIECEHLLEIEDAIRQLLPLNREGKLKLHDLRIRTPDAGAAPELHEMLFRLGASVEITGWSWPHPHGEPSWLADLLRRRVNTIAVLRTRADAIDDASVAACVQWSERSRVGIRLDLDCEGWSPSDRRLDALDRAIALLEGALGDCRIDGFPDDGAVNGERRRPEQPSLGVTRGARAELLRRHLLRRAVHLRSMEEGFKWAMVPEAEETWVGLKHDLLPSRPELLDLHDGAVVADICSGLGRVARRLAPHVGPDGMIVSVEKEGIFVSRARTFALDLGHTNIQFRRGLAQCLPLADESVDAAVVEWIGWMFKEDAADQVLEEIIRILRPNGRVAVTQMLCQLKLRALSDVRVDYANAYTALEKAFRHERLEVVERTFWGQSQDFDGKPISWLQGRFLPRLLDPIAGKLFPEYDQPTADIFLTIVAQKRA